MSHQNQAGQEPAGPVAGRRDLTPAIVAGVVMLLALAVIIAFLLTRGPGQTTALVPPATVAVGSTAGAPSSASDGPGGSAQTQDRPSSPQLESPEASPSATSVAATTPPAPVQEILEPGELPVSALPAAVGDYQLANFQGLYSYAKRDAPSNTGVSVTDVGDDFLPDELLSSIPGAVAIGDGRGVCGGGEAPLCHVGLTEYGSVMVSALDPQTTLSDVTLIAEAILATVG